MDILQQVKDKLKEMKSKYNQEHDDEDNPNHLNGFGMYWSGVFACLKEISFFVDHLEVKEVDLKKEYKDFVEKDPVYNKLVNGIVGKAIAKHFFELGLSVNNPITAADRGMAEEIIINLKRVEQDYRINLTKEMEWLRNQVKKRE